MVFLLSYAGSQGYVAKKHGGLTWCGVKREGTKAKGRGLVTIAAVTWEVTQLRMGREGDC